MEDNVVSIIQEVETFLDCRALCQKDSSCMFISFYGSNSFPFSQMCVLFSSCEELHECTDCKTEERTCAAVDLRICSSAVQGQIGGNMLEYLPGVSNETLCREACNKEAGCNFYTFYDLSDPFYPGACFLLSH